MSILLLLKSQENDEVLRESKSRKNAPVDLL